MKMREGKTRVPRVGWTLFLNDVPILPSLKFLQMPDNFGLFPFFVVVVVAALLISAFISIIIIDCIGSSLLCAGFF